MLLVLYSFSVTCLCSTSCRHNPVKELAHAHQFSFCSLQGFCYIFTSTFPHRPHVIGPVIVFNQPPMKYYSPSLLLYFLLLCFPVFATCTFSCNFIFLLSYTQQLYSVCTPHAEDHSLHGSCSNNACSSLLFVSLPVGSRWRISSLQKKCTGD